MKASKLHSSTLLCLAWAFTLLTASASERPNIVFILADDLGWRDLSVMGSEYYETPAIDQLAKDGALLTHAYASAPVCQPTRAAFLAGKTPARLHTTVVFDTDKGKEPLLPPKNVNYMPHEEITIAERLKELGYRTGMIGKWHFAPLPGYLPTEHGFDVNIAGCNMGKPKSYFSPYSNPELTDGPEGEYLTDRLAAEAAHFIESSGEDPFFLYLALYTPHIPLEAPEATIEHFRNKEPDNGHKEPVYAAMIAHMDAAVRTVLDTLEKQGLAENTIVVFTSDNGGLHPNPLYPYVTDNAPLRAGKFTLFEGGIRVPGIVRWPGKIPTGQTIDTPIVTHDWHTTFAKAAGADLADTQLDGVDLLPMLTGKTPLEPRQLGWHFPHYFVRQGFYLTKPVSVLLDHPWKVHYDHETASVRLYNLEKDLGETTDLAEKQPEKAARMKDDLLAWLSQNNAAFPTKNPAFPGVGLTPATNGE